MNGEEVKTLPVELMHPTLRPVTQEFLRKCKYPYKVFGGGRWLMAEEDGEQKQFSSMVVFHDPNAETMQPVGSLKWHQGDFGRPFKFRVITRHVMNPKYRDSERRKSIETLDPKRALKEMLTHFTPFELREIAGANNNYADNNIHRWKSEAQHNASHYFNIANDAIVREVQHLVAQGVQFTTTEFQEIALQGIPAYYDSQKRIKTKMHKHFVKFEKNGLISVLSPNGQSSFTSFNMLPSFIQETIGMLKLMKVSETEHATLPGVGQQVSDNMFWVFEQEERTGA